MSFKAVFQFILHFQEFMNIDLPSQGLVRLNASVYQQLNVGGTSTIVRGVPFQLSEQVEKTSTNSRKIFSPSDYDTTHFFSKVAVIRFSDEKVQLDDFIRFKLELESFPRLESADVYLEVELAYMPCFHSSANIQFNGEIVSTCKFHLEDIEEGLFNYCEGQFAPEYASKFSFTLFACLANFKFGKYWIPEVHRTDQATNANRVVSTKEHKRCEITTMEEFFKWIREFYSKKIPNPEEYFYETYVKNLRYYFYNTQLKANKKIKIGHKVVLKVSKSFLDLPSATKQKTEMMEGEGSTVSEAIFRKYMSNFKPENLTYQELMFEINEIYGDVYLFLINMEKEFLYDQLLEDSMKKEYITYIKQRYGERVFRSEVYGSNHAINSNENKRIAKKMREKQIVTSSSTYPIEDLSFIKQKDLLEFVFYEVCYPQKMKPESKIHCIPKMDQEEAPIKSQIHSVQAEDVSDEEISNIGTASDKEYESEDLSLSEDRENIYEGNILDELMEAKKEESELPSIKYEEHNMLVVMCHGFQGSQYDMLTLMRQIKQALPSAYFLLSKSNQASTDGKILEMGERLAKEIRTYIKRYLSNEKVIINFVGHSMGGVIARSSLKHLNDQFKDQFGFFASLSSPHLGYLNGVDNKIKAGLWMIRKFKPVESLSQLSMEDSRNKRDTFLYKLSESGSLKRFRKIILFSSYEDSYVAWHSARILKHHSTKKSEGLAIEEEMVENILGDRPVHRLDVNFEVRDKTIDSFIGRTAHINLIIQESLFRIINATLPDLFDITKP